MSKKRSVADTALDGQIWDLWIRGLSVDAIARRLNMTPVQVAKRIDAYLERQTKLFANIRSPDARMEKIISQLETLEQFLFLQITQYNALWGEKIKAGDEKGALEISEFMSEIINTLQTIVTRKAELMRRVGLLPSAPERVAAVVASVSPEQLIGEIKPRLPERAPLELPEIKVSVETEED